MERMRDIANSELNSQGARRARTEIATDERSSEGGIFDPTVTNPMFKLKAWIYAWIYAWIHAWIYACTDPYMALCMDPCMDLCMDLYMDLCMDLYMDSSIDPTHIFHFFGKMCFFQKN